MFSIARKSSGDYLVNVEGVFDKEFELDYQIESLCEDMDLITSATGGHDKSVTIYKATDDQIQRVEKMLDNYLQYFLVLTTEKMARKRQAVGHDLKVALLNKESVDFDDLEDYLALCD